MVSWSIIQLKVIEAEFHFFAVLLFFFEHLGKMHHFSVQSECCKMQRERGSQVYITHMETTG